LNPLRSESFRVADDGDTSIALLFDGPQMVAKLPRNYAEGYNRTIYEALALDAVGRGSYGPIRVPEMVDTRPYAPQHLLSTLTGGVTLKPEQVQRFSVAEQALLGQRIGIFAANLAATVSMDDHAEMMRQLPGFRIAERTDHVRKYDARRLMYTIGSEALASVLVETYLSFRVMKAAGHLEPSIVGHDDLRTDNMTFTQGPAGWELRSIFDFNLLKPSVPERELRHAVGMGDHVEQAAVEAYEATTGRPISRPLLRFWAVAQAATVCASYLRADTPQRARQSLKTLQRLFPDRDWSDIDRLTAGSPAS
jgi:hypothetical protein